MIRALTASLLMTAPLAHSAQAQVTGAESLEVLEEVVVVGRLPGPPLWKVTNGEHVLWILPLVNLYPKKMEWESTRVEALIAGSQEFIFMPRPSGHRFRYMRPAIRRVLHRREPATPAFPAGFPRSARPAAAP